MFKKLVSLLFALSFIFAFTADFTGVKATSETQIHNKKTLENTKKSKAIIFVHGVIAGGLFWRDKTCLKYNKNEAVWAPIDDNNKWRMVKGIAKLKFFYEDLLCDEDGKPLNENIGLPLENEEFPHEVDENIAKYGVWYAHKTAMDALTEQFPDYEVFLHNYDWRVSLDIAAKSLMEKIEKYEEVVIIGYSYGGIVACKSAVELYEKGEINKIKKYISLAVPYNGSVESLYVLHNGPVRENNSSDIISSLLGIPNIAKSMAKNSETSYALLPSKNYFKNSKTGGYVSDIKGRVLNYDETLEFIKNCKFSKKSDGTVKRFINDPQKFYNSLIVDGVHILKHLNYHLIVGCGWGTMSELTPNPKNMNEVIVKRYVDGDGTIALNESAIPFENIEDNRIFKVKGRHQFLIGNDEVIRNIISEIKNMINIKNKNQKQVA